MSKSEPRSDPELSHSVYQIEPKNEPQIGQQMCPAAVQQ